jgi:hypothetical protein
MQRDFRRMVPTLGQDEAVIYLEALILELIKERKCVSDLVKYADSFGQQHGMYPQWRNSIASQGTKKHINFAIEKEYQFEAPFYFCMLNNAYDVSVDRLHFALDVLMEHINSSEIFWTYTNEMSSFGNDERTRAVIVEMMSHFNFDIENVIEVGSVSQSSLIIIETSRSTLFRAFVDTFWLL